MPPGRGAGRAPPHRKDTELVYIAVLSVSMLRRLCEKTQEDGTSDAVNALLASVVPSNEQVLQALQMHGAEWTKDGYYKELVAYAALED